LATLIHDPLLLYCHWYEGAVPVVATLNKAEPPAHMLAFTGWVVITTGSHVEVTVTVRVKVLPTQVPVLGVTVYVAVPVPEGIERVPVILATGVG